MACRCATVPRTVPLLVHSFGFLIFHSSYSSLSLSFSCFLVFQHLFASFFLSFVPLSLYLSFTSRVLSRFSWDFSRHPSHFLHRDRSPTRQARPFNLWPINLDKLNEWRPAFDARVNREYFSPLLLRSPFGSSHSTTYVLVLFLKFFWRILRNAGEVIEESISHWNSNIVLQVVRNGSHVYQEN